MDGTTTAEIRQMQQRAEADLLAAAGDASLCVLAKSGHSYPAVKYHEGRAAVLSALLRSLATTDDLTESVSRERRRLLGLVRLAERDADWQGYIQGGLEALDRVESIV